MTEHKERNLKITISYDGLTYSGWQTQPGKNTIQGELEKTVGEFLGFYTKVNGASRTDAGVSALGQVANFVVDSPVPTENFVKALNHRLPRDIRVLDVEEVSIDFDSSSSAKFKQYRYKIFTGKNPDALQIRNCWHRPGTLDTAAMDQAAKLLIGQHDFKSFAAAADTRDNTVRNIMDCRVWSENNLVWFEIQADRFLYNMVRNIVGTLVEVGRGRWKPEKIKEILEAKTRTAAGPTAPPEGLFLMWIKY